MKLAGIPGTQQIWKTWRASKKKKKSGNYITDIKRNRSQMYQEYKPEFNREEKSSLEKIMNECPTPVIMVSSLTIEGAEITLKALELGAVDFIPKEMSFVSVSITSIKDELISKVKSIYFNKSVISRLNKVNLNGQKEQVKSISLNQKLPKINYKALAIGISTGGPISLQKLVPRISPNIKFPVFIVQHMPPKFTASLADRLTNLSKLEVKEAEDGEIVRNAVVYIAPGGFHMILKRDKLNNILINITESPKDVLHRPSVDVMLESVQKTYGKNMLGVIMTGMGKDGLEGIKKLKYSGGYCIAQDESSSVVYGMPKAIVENGLADVVASLDDIPNIINQAV